MIKAYKFRMYPNIEQQKKLNQFIGTSRFIYNYYNYQKQHLYKEEGKTYLLGEMKRDLINLQKEYTWLKEVDGSILRTTLDDLDRAYKSFFNKQNGYPKYKRKGVNGSYRTPCIVGSYKNRTYSNIKIDLNYKIIKLPKIEPMKIAGYRNLKKFPDKIYNATITKEADRYYVSLCVEEDVIVPKFEGRYAVGIDLGIKDIVVTSDGIKYKREQNIKKYEKKIKGLQRWITRYKIGSKNRYKVQVKLQRVYQKLKNARKYTLHKISKEIVENNDIIITEHLKIQNMTKNHMLAKSITDNSWSILIEQLKYKTKWQNKKFYQVDTYYASSKICSVCDKKEEKVKDLSVRKWECKNCGYEHNRDINASINILYEGLKKYAKEQLV